MSIKHGIQTIVKGKKAIEYGVRKVDVSDFDRRPNQEGKVFVPRLGGKKK